MGSETELIGGAIIIVLLALVISSFLRHLRFEERMLKWRIRIYFHILVFILLIVAAAYLYLQNK